MFDEQADAASTGTPAGPPSGETATRACGAGTEKTAAGRHAVGQTRGGRVFSGYGVGSAVLGAFAVLAVIASVFIWAAHRSETAERVHRTQVLQAAASWTSVLVNINAENVEREMQRLRDKTVGNLNREFDAAVQPYREVVQRIESRSAGRIEAVDIQTMRYRTADQADSADSADSAGLLPGRRSDPVMVVATSIAQNAGGEAQIIHWVLDLDVTDVDGDLMISRLRTIR